MAECRVLPAGDTALVIEFGNCIDPHLNARVLALAGRIAQAGLSGVVETVPTFRSLMVHFDPLVADPAALTRDIQRLLEGLPSAGGGGRLWRLPVCYHPSLAPDLDDVLGRIGLTPAQLIERHSAPTYHVYMLGFLPGNAYLGDLAPELALPRRPTPRPRVPAGSLAMVTRMTSIFPLETPSGWYLIGRSPVPLWDRRPGSEPLLRPGDKVVFAPVSLSEFECLQAQAARGELRVEPFDGLEAAA